MALAKTLLAATPSTSNAATYASASVSPTAGALLLVFVGNTDGSNAIRPTLTPTGFSLSGSWTDEGSIQASAGTRRLTIFSGIASGSPGTGTVTADFAGDSQTGCIVTIVQYTGQHATTPTRQFASNEGGGGGATSLSISLGGALLAATSEMIAVIGHNTNEAETAGSGGALLASSDVGYTTPDWRQAIITELNDTTVSASWSTSSAKLAAAIEAVEAAGTTSETPTPGNGVAGGVAPVAKATVSVGGADAQGVAPTAKSTFTIGGAPAGGTAATARAGVVAGGATAGGTAPADGAAASETPTPGGATAGGSSPNSLATVVIGGSPAGGASPGTSTPVGQGGATCGGVGQVVRVGLSVGGALAGGQLHDPLGIPAATASVTDRTRVSPSSGRTSGSPDSGGTRAGPNSGRTSARS